MPRRQALQWYWNLLLHILPILRTRKLYAADAAMPDEVVFRLYGQQFKFDVAALNSTPGNHYSLLRELFVRRIYFRGFRYLRLSRCLDLGCNTGVVSFVLRRLAAPDGLIVAVDAQTYQDNIFRNSVFEEAGIAFNQRVVCGDRVLGDRRRLVEMCSAFNFDPSLATSVDKIMGEHKLEHVDFLKVDIEGAEFDIFWEPQEWLTKIDNVAMEVHPTWGNPKDVISCLAKSGFDVSWCDSYGYFTGPEKANYIYASRIGALREPLHFKWGA